MLSRSNQKCRSDQIGLGWILGLRPFVPIWDLGLWGSFLGTLIHIYTSFGENQEKLRTARLSSATWD